MAGTIEETLKHALFLARHLNKCDLQCAALVALLELEIPTKRIGFDYLKNAIVLYADNPTQILSNGLYVAVGKEYDPEAGSLQVEQAIRSAITAGWKNRDESVWRYYFPPDGNGKLKKPSNAEFITRVAYFLELWQGCCKEVVHE